MLEDVVEERYRLAPKALVATLMSLEKLLWVYLCAGVEDPANLQADRLIFLDRVGYLLIERAIFDAGFMGTLAQQAHEHAFPDVPYEADSERFGQSFKRLAYLEAYRAENISLEDGHPWVIRSGDEQPSPVPRPFVYPAGSTARLINLYALGEFVRGLYECLAPPQKAGQRVSKDLELRLDEYLGEDPNRPRAFPSGMELWRRTPGGRKVTVVELDASFRVGTVLVAIDAKSIPLSPGYQRYQYGALKTRWEKFAGDARHEGYIEKADKQARALAQHPRGTNYDLPSDGFTHVVTLLCSTHPEYVDTDDPNYYLRANLPRIATPQELRNFLAETDEAELKALPFTRHLADAG